MGRPTRPTIRPTRAAHRRRRRFARRALRTWNTACIDQLARLRLGDVRTRAFGTDADPRVGTLSRPARFVSRPVIRLLYRAQVRRARERADRRAGDHQRQPPVVLRLSPAHGDDAPARGVPRQGGVHGRAGARSSCSRRSAWCRSSATSRRRRWRRSPRRPSCSAPASSSASIRRARDRATVCCTVVTAGWPTWR